MVKRLLPAAVGFAVGSVILVVSFGISWGDWLGLSQDSELVVIRALAASLGLVLLLMTMFAILASGRLRWVTVSLVALLLLGFSAFAILSFGIFTALIGLLLLAVSIWKLSPPTKQMGNPQR